MHCSGPSLRTGRGPSTPQGQGNTSLLFTDSTRAWLSLQCAEDKYLSRDQLPSNDVPHCRFLAHRSRAEAFQVERPEAAASSSEHEPALASLSMPWGQRVREWRFKPMGLEPTPELAAVAVGVPFA